MNLLALPASADTYIWMLHDGASAAVVDPGEAGPVHEAPDRLGLQLAAILVTHHHADPVGGVDELRARLRGPVYGPATEIIPEPVHRLTEGEQIEVLGLRFAAAVEPVNARRRDYEARCAALRSSGQPPLPSSIGTELQVNPFLRCTEPEVAASALAQGAASAEPLADFTALPEWKNRFR